MELRTLYNTGNLPDVDTLVSHNGLLGIHSDEHCHAEQLLTDSDTLIWLESIYDYNVLEFGKEYTYTTDIKRLLTTSQIDSAPTTGGALRPVPHWGVRWSERSPKKTLLVSTRLISSSRSSHAE